jgi:hypothetical protein
MHVTMHARHQPPLHAQPAADSEGFYEAVTDMMGSTEMSLADLKVRTGMGRAPVFPAPAEHARVCAHHPPTHLPPPTAQAALLDSLYGTERGMSARSEVRAEINELISQLEAKNPVPNPTEVRACAAADRAGLCARI